MVVMRMIMIKIDGYEEDIEDCDGSGGGGGGSSGGDNDGDDD